MITEEQIKNLKPGDTVLVEAKVGIVTATAANVSHGCISHLLPFNKLYPVPEQPKHDHCREFKEGDRVRMVMRDGRHPYCLKMRESIVPTDTICNVVRCESNGFVVVEYENGYNPVVHFSFLELVTPVEELEPYYVVTNTDCSTCTIFKRVGEKKLVHSAYYFMHGNGCSNALMGIIEAQAAAKSECARLNAKYRKEQE